MIQLSSLMKTAICLFLLVCFGSTQTLLGQGTQNTSNDSAFKHTPAHHLALQAGIGSVPQILNKFAKFLNSYYYAASTDRYTNKIATGALFAQYHFAPKKRFRFGLGIGIDHVQEDIEMEISSGSYSFEKYGTYYNKTYTIVLECMFVYNKNEFVKLYGKLGASRHSFSQRVETVDPAEWSKSINNNYYAGQLTPIAVEVGKEISGFAEFGFGYNGILSAGIRGKF